MSLAHVLISFLLIFGKGILIVGARRRGNGDNILEVCENSGALTFAKYARNTPWVNSTLQNSSLHLMALAPTDRAFDELPSVIKTAIKDPQTLEWYLRYHIALGVAYLEDIDNNLRIPSAFRPPGPTEDLPEVVLTIRFNVYDIRARETNLSANFGKVVTASGSPIIQPNIPASNGIVHIIDKVIFPLPTGADMAEYLHLDGRFSSLYGYLQSVNLTAALKTDPSRPLTVFAPSNAAFANLPNDIRQKLKDKSFLTQVLEYHVAQGALYAAGLYDNLSVRALNGQDLLVEIGPGGVYVQEGKVLQADNTVINGVVHEISAVLIPPK